MKIFVVNRGSSSIKCYLYNNDDKTPVWEAQLDASSAPAFETMVKSLLAAHKVDAIGHRIVHGGKYFTSSVRIDAEVKEKIRRVSELAPLHNLAELESIEAIERLMPGVPNFAVFDTAFHQTMPRKAVIYPGPYKWYEDGIQRYGFHGISYQYVSRRVSQLLNQPSTSKLVACHLGAGASLCAIKNGKSIDTTMGFTPLEGLMMDTRSGSVDPGILLRLLEKKSSHELAKELNEQSGLLGVSGFSSDMREIIVQSAAGNARATLALDIYIHRLNSLIGSMIASLGGLEALVFTAGIGENAPLIRERVCNNFSFLGTELDKSANQTISSSDREISAEGSKIKVLVIHTQEAFEIARECARLLDDR